MKSFLVPSFTQITTFGTIILIFTNSVLFEREVACTCREDKNQTTDCYVYITLPVFVIMFLVLWRDKNYFSTCIYIWSKRKHCCKCWSTVPHLMKAVLVGLLWIIAVLLDGDWYACCQNGFSGENATIPCKTDRTSDEQVTVDELKNWSKVIGVSTLLGLVGGLYILSLLRSCKCCREFSCCKDSSCCKNYSCCLDENDLYEVVCVKEKEDLLEDIFKKRYEENLKAEFKQGKKEDQVRLALHDDGGQSNGTIVTEGGDGWFLEHRNDNRGFQTGRNPGEQQGEAEDVQKDP